MRASVCCSRFILGVALVAGCKGKEGAERSAAGDAFGAGSDRSGYAAARVAVGARKSLEGDVSAADTASLAPPAVAPAPGQQPATPATTEAPMLVRTGTATIKVDSLEPAVARVRAIAQKLGGFVGDVSMQTGSEQVRSAEIEVKVPAARWGDLLGGLRPLGEVEHVDESIEDVGEEFVDVGARMANARRLEERLITLLANRTGKLSDALAVERELARVREEIERYEGRLRYLRAHAAMSTMTVTIHEPGPIVGAPGDHPISSAFRDMWRNFVASIAFIIASLGVLVPLGVVAWIVWYLVRRFRWKPLP